ncbi:MAG: rhodanese-like protein [uncultured bacterium]|nr:MAG: rhodanese-like protein [uncultured bacterium]
MNKKEKNKNENRILLFGFSLIILVIVFTLFRSKLFSESGDANSTEDNQSSSQLSSPTYSAISANDLNKKILTSSKKDFVLLDIRPFEAYIAEHIMDSINIPVDEFPVSSKIDTHSQVIIIGEKNGDENISVAVEKLKEEKIENIKVLAGGMESWKQIINTSVTYGNPKSFVDQSKVSYLEPELLNSALVQKIPVFIVDVRTPEEYARGHIEGAINVPFDDLEKKRSDVTERKIVVVGINELQEFQASVQLYDMLLISPLVMKGAMPAWESKGFALVK